ncbi:hypothetical protein EDC04DRAFT_2610420 [Pisolithus marmoratus]|nr:hypothetical protein EDC04DRAFT_2610420 [Pisolithus marmoratus]
MNAASATDQALSALVHHTLSSVLGHSRLSASAVLQRCDLQKPRLRVRSQLTNLQRHMADEPLPPASISCQELKLTALVISHAILNPWEDVTEWDVDRFAEPMKNVMDKTKYFPHPQWGHISDPTTILDVHGRVLVWYLPGIIPPARVVILSPPPPSPCIDSSEYFWRLMDPQRLEDQVYESSSLKKPAVRQWLRDIAYAEDFWNTIAEIVLPDLAQVGKEAISAKQHWVTTQPCALLDVIVNQETPPHQDQASAPSLLDLVPGTMVFLAGKLLTHSVPKWEKGERIALAHYMKDAIHNLSRCQSEFMSENCTSRALPMFHIDPGEHTSKKVQSLVKNLCPPRPEGESSPTKKWMLGTSTSHLASQNDFVREWLPWRAEYLNVILEGEQLAKAGICEQCEEAEGSVQCRKSNREELGIGRDGLKGKIFLRGFYSLVRDTVCGCLRLSEAV